MHGVLLNSYELSPAMNDIILILIMSVVDLIGHNTQNMLIIMTIGTLILFPFDIYWLEYFY